MLYNFTPYCPKGEGKNLGLYYNKYMELLPNDEDWGILMDHDIMFTTYDWYNQINDIINKYDGVLEDLGMLTVVTNRIGQPNQLINDINLRRSNDIQIHRNYGQQLYNEKYDKIKIFENKGGLSGLVMIMKKSVWKESGGFMENGILGVDNNMHSKLINKKKDVYIMEGVYVYHWYRNNNFNDKKHLM